MRTSENNFRGIFDAVAEAIIIRDAESFQVVDANRKAEEMFGYTLEELKAGPIDMTSSGEAGFDLANSRRVLKEAAEGKPQFVVWKARRKDGGVFWVESSLSPAVLDGKNRLVGTVRDISWRKAVEEDLRRSEERYRDLVESANSIILRWGPEGKISFINDYGLRFFGYTPREVLGKDTLMLVPRSSRMGEISPGSPPTSSKARTVTPTTRTRTSARTASGSGWPGPTGCSRTRQGMSSRSWRSAST